MPLVFAVLMLFGMTATVNAAGDIYTMEMAAEQVDDWDRNTDPS